MLVIENYYFVTSKKGVLFVFTMNDDFGGPFKQGI